MILHDRVTITTTTPPTGEDAYGNPTGGGTVTLGPFPAEIRPVNSDETLTATSDTVTTTYRMLLDAKIEVTTTATITWRGNTYTVHGDVEKHTLAGRVHHQEALIRRYAG